MTNRLFNTILLLIIFISAGCAQKSASDFFVREEVDLGFVQRVAVFPLQNNSDDKFAAKRLRNIVNTQILAEGLFDTADQGLVDSVLLREAVEPGMPVDQVALKRLGQRLKVQAFFMGAVDQAAEVRRGSATYPEVALTLRLVEAESGKLLWQASGYRNGESLSRRLFGLAATDSFQVSLVLVNDLLSSLAAQ